MIASLETEVGITSLYGIKINMLLEYNILLIITLLTWLLNRFVCVFKPHDFILCFLAKTYLCYY